MKGAMNMAKEKKVTSNPLNVFTELKEAYDFFENQKKTDLWQTCKTEEISIMELYNNPIMLQVVKQDMDMTNVSDKTVEECMETHKLAVRFPTESKMLTFPIRDTAFKTICERAGIGGRTLSCIEDKTRQAELDPQIKALIFNECLKCYSSKSLVLVRDDAVSAILSGDESDYQRLPMIDLIKTLESSLETFVSDYELFNSKCDYEIAQITYRLFDDELTKAIKDAFIGIKKGMEVIPYIKLVTSDVGISGANLYPVVVFEDGTQILLGEGIKTKHKGAGAYATFEENSKRIFALFIENAKKIADLKKIRIKHAGGCARNIANHLKFPKKESLETLADLDTLASCTALDIYMAIFSIVEAIYYDRQSKKKPLSEKELLEWNELASEVAYLDFKRYDFDFEWK